MNDTDAQRRARARLLLRAERAFGVDALPVVFAPQPQPVKAAAESTQDATAPSAPVLPPPRPQPAPAGRGSAADLFGVADNPSAASLPRLPVSEPYTAPPLTTDEKRRRLAAMDADEVSGCTRCRLCQTRTNTVFGEGSPDAQIFFIGEGPGETEDQTGRPFVGRAGELLTRMIGAMGLTRQDVYIANIVKCRPPGNREPAPDEVATCTPYLERQIEIVRPRVIVTLGRPALQHMLGQKVSISRMRGQWQWWRGIRLMPTFHPAYILRQYTPQTRAAVWSDLKLVMSELGLAPPAKKDVREV